MWLCLWDKVEKLKQSSAAPDLEGENLGAALLSIPFGVSFEGNQRYTTNFGGAHPLRDQPISSDTGNCHLTSSADLFHKLERKPASERSRLIHLSPVPVDVQEVNSKNLADLATGCARSP